MKPVTFLIVDAIQNNAPTQILIASSESLEIHLMVFAAEESRQNMNIIEMRNI